MKSISPTPTYNNLFIPHFKTHETKFFLLHNKLVITTTTNARSSSTMKVSKHLETRKDLIAGSDRCEMNSFKKFKNIKFFEIFENLKFFEIFEKFENFKFFEILENFKFFEICENL